MTQHTKQQIINATAAMRRSIPFLKGAGVCILISAVTLAAGGCASSFEKACKHGNDPAVITAYINKGADPNKRMGGAAWTPLQYAAIYNSNPAIIKALIDEGADPNDSLAGYSLAIYHMTPLQMAAFYKVKRSPEADQAIVQALIDGGADVNKIPPYMTDRNQLMHQYSAMTPLQLAIMRGKTAMAETLRKNGGHE